MPKSIQTQCIICSHSCTHFRRLCDLCRDSLPYAHSPCVCCGIELPASAGINALCGRCLCNRPPVNHTLPLLRYEFPVPGMIARFKDHAQFAEGELLSALLAELVHKHHSASPRPDYLIPVPLHPQRLRRRGFNQSVHIAKHIEDLCGVPLLSNACLRQHNTPMQRGLRQCERQKNLHHAFELAPQPKQTLKDKHIAIVDDVVTTCSTVNALAQLLKLNEAQRIDVYCLARVAKPAF